MKKRPSITIPVQKVHTWAAQGKSSEQVAENIGITVEDLFDSLSSLAEKNRKSATHIRQLLAANDKKANRNSGKAQSPKNSASPSITTQSQSTPKHTSTTPVQAETAPKAAPTEKKMSAEAEALQREIEKTEKTLETINDAEANALAEIEESKQLAHQYAQELENIAAMLRKAKANYEEQISKLHQAEQNLIACGGRRAAETSRLAELKATLRELAKPEVYVCEDGEIVCENVSVPEHIDTSRWTTVFDYLPEEIAGELRKKDAELLIRLRAIMSTIERDDASLCFDSDLLKTAYEALSETEAKMR